jgi:starch-binding outer membrane protein SusE/F
MKNIKKINAFIMVILGVMAFNSCSDLDDMPQIGTTTSPEFTDPDVGKVYVLTAEAVDNTFEVYSWSEAKWGTISTPVLYTVQIALPETDFAKPVTVATTNACPLRISVSEMNTAIASLGIKKALATDLEMRLVANPINENSGIITKLDTLYSKSLSLTVTPYFSFKVIKPLYIVGSVLGNKSWDAGNYPYLMFKDNSETDNKVFTYTTNFKAGEFKLLVDLNTWTTAWGYDGSGKIVQMDNGGNLVATAGYQTMTFDTSNGTLTYTNYDATAAPSYASIGLIGDFNSWGGDILLTQTDYDPHIWVADNVALTAGGVKFRANAAWTSKWGGSDFPYGIGDTSDSAGNIPVDQDGNYFIKLNDLTGHYVFYKL